MASTTYGSTFDIVPSDTVNLPQVANGFYVGGAGAVTIVTLDGQPRTFPGMLAGTVYKFQIRKVMATGTTATGLIGLVF